MKKLARILYLKSSGSTLAQIQSLSSAQAQKILTRFSSISISGSFLILNYFSKTSGIFFVSFMTSEKKLPKFLVPFLFFLISGHKFVASCKFACWPQSINMDNLVIFIPRKKTSDRLQQSPADE